MAPIQFRGTLKSKRKVELQELVELLQIDVAERASKLDLEQAIRTHLLANSSSLASDARFAGLFESLERSEKRIKDSLPSPDEESDDSPDTGLRSRRRPSSRTGNGLPPNSVERAPAQATRSRTSSVVDQSPEPKPHEIPLPPSTGKEIVARVANALTPIRRGLRGARENVERALDVATSTVGSAEGEVAEDVEGAASKVRGTAVQAWLESKRWARKTFVETRHALSKSETIIKGNLIAELFYIVYSSTPVLWHEFDSSSSRRLPHSGSPAFSAPYPDYHTFMTCAFWQPILLWAGITVLLPLIAASFVSFERRTSPSPATFVLFRLSLLVYLVYLLPTQPNVPRVVGVAAGQVPLAKVAAEARRWVSYEWVLDRVPGDLQVLAAATSTGVAYLEAIVKHRR